MGSLRTPAQGVLPDPLAGLPGLEARAVYAMDGTYQHESARYGRRTPHQGGEDHPKGHARLSFYDVRLGVPADVSVATRNRHETALRRDYDQGEQALTGHQEARWLVDRGFIEARFWDQKKRRLGITTITRMRRGLRIDSTEDLPVAELPVNAGVETDLQVTLSRARALWRLIGYRTRRGHRVEFLTNELALQPGLLAFLSARRWEEAPCFATWKHDFSQAKAWGAHRVAIDNPVRLAMIASILVALRLHRQMGQYGIDDEQALRKQDRRQTSKTDGTERPDWSTPLFRYTSKVSRQVVRFFKHGFHKPASQALYESQLRPMLVAYL